MRHRSLIVSAVLGAVACVAVPGAEAGSGLSVGAILWRHSTPLQVERATDFDGSNDTAGQRARNWDVQGSGVGVRISYELPQLVTLFGEAGTAQATVRDRAVSPSQSVDSRGLNNGGYFAVGARLGGGFASARHMFWSLGGALSAVSTALDQDVTTRWEYDHTLVSMDARVGTWLQRVGLYGGLRLVHSKADLLEIDRTNPIGQQMHSTELTHDGAAELLLGAQTRGTEFSGFTEVGLVGTFSATAGLMLRF